jgi:hypothetical protein
MRLVNVAIVSLAILANARSSDAGEVLYYGGDPVAGGAAFNELIPSAGVRISYYDNFLVISGTTFSISAIFANIATPAGGIVPVNAYYEIRTDMPSGNGGTLLYSGTLAITNSYPGPGGPINGTSPGLPVNHIVADLDAPIVLGEGAYWFTLTPISVNSFNQFVGQGGANSVNLPADVETFTYTNVPPTVENTFAPATPPSLQASLGLEGDLQTVTVPEPPSFILLGLAIAIGATGRYWQRRKKWRQIQQIRSAERTNAVDRPA